LAPKVLRRCSICGNFHASYLVKNPQFGKGYYCYSCWKAWQVKHALTADEVQLIEEVTMTLSVGQTAPDFTLPSQLEKKITLSDLRGTNVVLAFFPLAWTPI
jgi:hypothetical protein